MPENGDMYLIGFCTHLNRKKKKGKLGADSVLIKRYTRRGVFPTLFKSSPHSSQRMH